MAEVAFASPREPPDEISPGLDEVENAKESPSDPDTRVQESEAMPSRMSKCRVVAVTGRFATPWSTRAQWSCFGFFCGLAKTAGASDEVIVNGYRSCGYGTTTGVMEAADSNSTFAVNAGAGGAVAGVKLVWRVASAAAAACGVSRRGSALGCSRALQRGKSRGVRVRSIGVCSVRTDG